VTDDNKEEYIRIRAHHKLVKSIQRQTESFLEGFHALIPPRMLRFFTPADLEAIICGTGEIDLGDWETHCQCEDGMSQEHPKVQWFFRVIRGWDFEHLQKLVMFVTGSTQPHVGGFAAFRNAETPFCIGARHGQGALPCAHTCLFKLDLPDYDTDEEMDGKLRTAITNCVTFELC
jgi:hypothetical protein